MGQSVQISRQLGIFWYILVDVSGRTVEVIYGRETKNNLRTCFSLVLRFIDVFLEKDSRLAGSVRE